MTAPRRWLLLAAVGVLFAPATGVGQAVPEGSQADRLRSAWRRSPSFRMDPFRHVALPHWGFVLSVGGRAANNALNFSDLGALLLLDEQDDVLVGDIIDAMGLVPAGGGLGGAGEAESGVYVGGPFGGRVRVGVSVQGRGYGSFLLDDEAVALLRDGNLNRTEFSLGESRGAALGTLEGGVHALVRLGPVGSVDGMHLVLGGGMRHVRAVAYASGSSLIAGGGRILVSGDSVAANLDIEAHVTPIDEFQDALDGQGSGIAGDFLVRAEWPTSGIAFEAMVANIGTVSLDRVERRALRVDLATTSLDTVLDVLDTLDLAVQDSVSRDVTLPRLVRFSASAWANRILQLDASLTLGVRGEFAVPAAIDLGSTWRLANALPLRVGMVLGGYQGVGYTAGIGIEGRHFLFRVAGESLGGLFRSATGAGGRFELGILF